MKELVPADLDYDDGLAKFDDYFKQDGNLPFDFE
jgi:hypothetical protein